MASSNHFETPTIASNSSSNAEFYDAESNDDSDTCCVFKSLAEIEVTRITKEGKFTEEFCCAKCGRSVQELIDREKLKQEELKTNALDKMQTLAEVEPLEKQELHTNNTSNDSRALESISESDSFTTPELSKDSVLEVSPEQNIKNDTNNALTNTNSLSSADSALIQDPIWRGHKKHIFILSEAGKPIYSLHGSEDKLAILFGIIQALVSFVENTQDVLTSIHARGIQFVFMIKSHLIFVAASRTNMSVAQLQMQLNDVHNQILSTLTFTQLTKIFQHRKNFDLRRLLEGSERLINNLLLNDSSNKKVTNNVFTFLTNSIRCLPMQPSIRSSIVSAIKDNCGKIKNLVFAILIAKNRLICLVRMKKYSIHQSDLRLIFNLIDSTESFKTSENWTPICLPKFDMNGYLHAHVSYLDDECPACLLLLTVDRDDFFTLSSAKKSITEKMKRSQCLENINESVQHITNLKYQLNAQNIGIPELRHFIYKPKSTAQVLCSELVPPYTSLMEFERLEGIYCDLMERVHHTARPLKLIFEAKSSEVILAWSTATYELYAIFEPLTKKSTVIKNVDKLIKWIDKEYDTYFIRTHPTF
ncbi:protein SAND [Lucilia cuprina]|uniref:protein SAND n=1 Tax=Lucilia cuprina TaxID=7375 RepID=UPI000C71BA67|nr:protein SAND [Lucilia cuprina]KAI8118660.1 Vacuolar fusion protein MON1 like protein A [Lucilia cuprina]